MKKNSGKCRKNGFRTEVDAKIALSRIQWQDKPHRMKMETRAYKCNLCPRWHLTSTPLRTKTTS